MTRRNAAHDGVALRLLTAHNADHRSLDIQRPSTMTRRNAAHDGAALRLLTAYTAIGSSLMPCTGLMRPNVADREGRATLALA